MKWYYWLLIILVGLAIYTFGIQALTSAVKDRAYGARQAVQQVEIEVSEKRVEESEQRVAALQAKLGSLQAQIHRQELTIAVAGQNAEKVLERLKDEDERFAKDAAEAGRAITGLERCANLCARLQRLRLITAAEAADCRGDCERDNR